MPESIDAQKLVKLGKRRLLVDKQKVRVKLLYLLDLDVIKKVSLDVVLYFHPFYLYM